MGSLCVFNPDKIAIPDFGTGAMENWGLITYRETNLLYDESQSSSDNKQRVASVIAHELVHQVLLFSYLLLTLLILKQIVISGQWYMIISIVYSN